jgi:Fe-S cluster biosynthesis and repair protein YggX
VGFDEKFAAHAGANIPRGWIEIRKTRMGGIVKQHFAGGITRSLGSRSQGEGIADLKPQVLSGERGHCLIPLQWFLGARRMAHTVFCTRNKKEMEGLDEPPFDSEFGQKIYKNVSKAAWGEWVERQKMLLNEYRLQPWTPQAQQFLVEQMEQFFFGEGSALPSDYVPPSH